MAQENKYMNNNQSKKSVCCEKCYEVWFFKGENRDWCRDIKCSNCHSSQDLEGEKSKCCGANMGTIIQDDFPIDVCQKCGLPETEKQCCLHCRVLPQLKNIMTCDFKCPCHSKPVSEGRGHSVNNHKINSSLTDSMSNTLRSEEWEIEFDKLTEHETFYDCESAIEWVKNNKTLFSEEVYPESEFELDFDKVKSFITKLLTSERQRAYKEGKHDGYAEEGNKCYEHTESARADERKKMGEEVEKEFTSKLVHCGGCLKETIGCRQVGEFKSFLALLNKEKDK